MSETFKGAVFVMHLRSCSAQYSSLATFWAQLWYESTDAIFGFASVLIFHENFYNQIFGHTKTVEALNSHTSLSIGPSILIYHCEHGFYNPNKLWSFCWSRTELFILYHWFADYNLLINFLRAYYERYLKIVKVLNELRKRLCHLIVTAVGEIHLVEW